MIKPRHFFLRKWKEDLKFQYNAWRIVVDWTVLVYLLIPAAIILFFQYRQWILSPPEWMLNIPGWAVAAVLAIYASRGIIRWYTEEADSLFLLQQTSWLKKIKLYGAIYSGCKKLFSIVIAFALLSPILLNHSELQLELATAAMFAFWTYAFGLCLMSLKPFTYRAVWWKKWIVASLLYVSGFLVFMTCLHAVFSGWISWLLLSLLGIFLLAIAIFLIHLRASNSIYWEVDMEQDKQQKMRLVAMLMQNAVEKRRMRLRRPLLFRESNALFKKRNSTSIYTEIGIKAFFRDGKKISVYLRFASIGTAAIILTPLFMKPVVWLLLHGAFWSYLQVHTKDLNEAYFSEYVLQNEKLPFQSQSKMLRWIQLPLFIYFLFIVSLNLAVVAVMRTWGV